MFHVKHMFKKDRISIRVKDFIASDELYKLYEDKDTGIVWTDVGESHNHAKYYISDKYIPHSNNKGLVYDLSQKIMFIYKHCILNKYFKRSKTILDYGSGDGKFVSYLEKNGIKALAYDPLKGKEKKTVNLIQNIDFQSDMIMMWHVLEHIPGLQNALSQILKKLNKEGILVVAVPNRDCFDAKIYKEYWAAWDAPRHLYHFNHKSLVRLMSSHGLSLKSKKPLFLDSFYVSYLSEKYKKSHFPILSAVFVGMLSNFLACFSRNYSSSIYVFVKN